VRGQLRARPRATVVPDPQLSIHATQSSQVKPYCMYRWLAALAAYNTLVLRRTSRNAASIGTVVESVVHRQCPGAFIARHGRLGTSAVGHTVTVGEMRACLSADKRCSPQEHSPAHRGSSQSSSLRTDSTGNASRLPIYTRACVLRVRVHACVCARVRVRACVRAHTCMRVGMRA
jgi:hypothetical protein